MELYQTLNLVVQNQRAIKPLNISSANLAWNEAFTVVSFPEVLASLESGAIVVEFNPHGQVDRYLADLNMISEDE